MSNFDLIVDYSKEFWSFEASSALTKCGGTKQRTHVTGNVIT